MALNPLHRHGCTSLKRSSLPSGVRYVTVPYDETNYWNTANKWLINNLSRQSCQNFFTSPIVLRLVHLTWNYSHRFENLLEQRSTDFDRCRKTIFVIIFHFISDLLRWKSSPRNFRSKRSSSNWFIIQFSHRKGNSERWIFLSITNSLWKLYLIRRERGLRIIWNKFYIFLDKYLGIIG